MSQIVKPYNTEDSKKQEVATMFNNIAERYDFLNHFFSLGIDKLWRRKMIQLMRLQQPKYILDVATGTGDLAIAELKLNPDKIVGLDISQKMLDKAVIKAKNANIKNIEFIYGDSENIQFKDATFDAVSVAFGVRNYENLIVGLGEMRRVLKENGQVYILEFSKPQNIIIQKIYYFYFNNVLPFIGKIVSKDARAYTYLPESVKVFPDGKKFVELLQYVGFKEIKCKPLSFGVSTIYTAKK